MGDVPEQVYLDAAQAFGITANYSVAGTPEMAGHPPFRAAVASAYRTGPRPQFGPEHVARAVQRLIDNAYVGDVGELDRDDLEEIARIVLTSSRAGQAATPDDDYEDFVVAEHFTEPVTHVVATPDGPRTWALPDGAQVEEQWGMRYLLNGQRYEAGDGGHVFDSRDQAAQHIEAWRRAYPTLTYTDVEYLRLQVITLPWEPADATPAAGEDTTHG